MFQKIGFCQERYECELTMRLYHVIVIQVISARLVRQAAISNHTARLTNKMENVAMYNDF